MRLRFVIFLAIVVLIAACQGPPPTQIVMVVTATPAENIPTQTPYIVVVTATTHVEIGVTSTPNLTLTPTTMPAQSPFTPIPVLNAYPTNTIVPIQAAEQIFEGGRMFWLEPSRQIWVMVEMGDLNGRWFVFDDTFQDGDQESDPTILPPDGYLQPVRGFGKIWRDNPNIREALGWATAAELGYVSNYEYHPGGTLNSRGLYEVGPGYHILYSQTNQAIRFNEGLDQGVWTWQFVSPDVTPSVTP